MRALPIAARREGRLIFVLSRDLEPDQNRRNRRIGIDSLPLEYFLWNSLVRDGWPANQSIEVNLGPPFHPGPWDAPAFEYESAWGADRYVDALCQEVPSVLRRAAPVARLRQYIKEFNAGGRQAVWTDEVWSPSGIQVVLSRRLKGKRFNAWLEVVSGPTEPGRVDVYETEVFGFSPRAGRPVAPSNTHWSNWPVGGIL